MTLPTLIAKYQEKVTVTKVKKSYSVLLNAYNLALMNDGTPDTAGILKTVRLVWGLDTGGRKYGIFTLQRLIFYRKT